MQTLKLTYLIKSAEVKARFLNEELPKGVDRDAVGTYAMNDGELYILSFSTNGCTVAGARILSRLRRKLRDADARLLVDDASLKFAIMLYPRLAEYERKLRRVIILATCTGQSNSDEKLINELEDLSLEQLAKRIFYGSSFQNTIRDKIKKDPFTKDEIAKLVDQLDEDTVWDRLFETGTLASVRLNYRNLQNVRNKVMHHRIITESDYDKARRELSDVINELDAYIEKVRSDVNYPKQQAIRAANAIKLFTEDRESELLDYADAFERIADFVGATQEIANKFDVSKITGLASQLEIMRKNESLLGKSFSDSLKAMRSIMPSWTYEDIGQRLGGTLTNESLVGLSIPNTFSIPDVGVPSSASIPLTNVDESTPATLKQLNIANECSVDGDSVEDDIKDNENDQA